MRIIDAKLFVNPAEKPGLPSVGFGWEEEIMKNQWLVWAFIAGVIVIVIVAFNSENQRKTGHYAEDVPAEVQYEDESAIHAEAALPAAPIIKEGAKKVAASVQAVKQEAVVTAQETYQIAQSKAGTDADQVVSQAESAVVAPASNEVSDFTGVAYTIQIASVKELKDAQRALADVLKKDYPGYIVQRNLGDKGVWYRVYVGKFDTKPDADAYLGEVQKGFPSAFVIAPPKKNG